MTLEREAKLAVERDAVLPELDAEGVVVTAPTTRRLWTTYWDTPERALERAGSSLRHRHEGQWTAKRGSHTSALVLSRGECHFDGAADEPPVEALEFLALPGAPDLLRPVVGLRVDRRLRKVHAADDGRMLIDAIDDDVVVLGEAGQELGRFREVELEIVDDAGEAVLAAYLERVAAAGIVPDPPLPKYERAMMFVREADG